MNNREVHLMRRCWIALLLVVIINFLGPSVTLGEELTKTETSSSEITPTRQQLLTQIAILQDQLKKLVEENATLRQGTSPLVDGI